MIQTKLKHIVLYLIWTRNGQSIVIYDNGSQQETRSSAVAVIADRTAYDVRLLVYLQNIKLFLVTSLRTAGTHDPIQRVPFMSSPKLCLLKRDH